MEACDNLYMFFNKKAEGLSLLLLWVLVWNILVFSDKQAIRSLCFTWATRILNAASLHFGFASGLSTSR